MTAGRRAGAPRLIDWTGERCVPWGPDVPVLYEHMHRYLWAAQLVGGLRVLDVGCGEGFGAAILGQRAASVVGVDIDERTVEHARLNYASPTISFRCDSATDLSALDAQSFGAVVAFEVIEHLDEQELMLAEIARVLDKDGLLILSTPDRLLYSDGASPRNPFHRRELSQGELAELLKARFAQLALFGQRTITGSHLARLDESQHGAEGATSSFFIERSGDEWRQAADPAPLYMMAVASNSPLPTLPRDSTLADCGLELMRVPEREVARLTVERQHDAVRFEREREKQAVELLAAGAEEANRAAQEHEREIAELAAGARLQTESATAELERLGRLVLDLGVHGANRDATVAMLQDQLEAVSEREAHAQLLLRKAEDSVTWRLFLLSRSKLFGAIGEDSPSARTLRWSLRVLGRHLTSEQPPLAPAIAPQTAPPTRATIIFPTFEQPLVSIIVALHTRADLTRACLMSIRDHTPPTSYELILVDDLADAATKELLGSVEGARIVTTEHQLGYLRSINCAAESATGRWLVVCNNDIEVHPGWLAALLECAESADDIGVVTPRYIYPDGRLNEAGALLWTDGTGVNYGRGEDPQDFHYRYRREVDYGSGAALLVRGEFWRDVGGFDELFLPMYYEDADLCFAAREHGWRVVYEPAALVTHLEGATAGTDLSSGLKRHQEDNRPKFVEKWRRQLERDHMRPANTHVRRASDRRGGPRVLIVDHRVPAWDRDAGSLRLLRMIEALQGLGARVTLLPDNFHPLEPYTTALERSGVEVFHGPVDIRGELAEAGPSLALAILCRPTIASRWLDLVREYAPAARAVYDTVDLHWLRETRRRLPEYVDDGARRIPPQATVLRELEHALIRSVDVTFAVSDVERRQIEADLPGAEVRVVPTVHELERDVPAPEGRSGVLFIGGFEHHPNVGAALRLIRDIMPLVWREFGDVPVTIVGADAPPEICALASARVDVAGWVEDLGPLLRRSRVMVAPIVYGAGLKGKVTQSLAAGLPVVTTPVGAEGLGVEDGDRLLVGATDDDLAARTIAVLRDNELWTSLSRGGQQLVAEHCSPAHMRDSLAELLDPQSPFPEPLAARVFEPAETMQYPT